MTLADAARAAVGAVQPLVTAMGAVQVGTKSLAAVVTSPAMQLRPDFRTTAFHATPAELAIGIMNALDPRRNIFRASPAELAVGRIDDFAFRALFIRRDRGGF